MPTTITRRCRSDGKLVKCVETGELFPNVRAACHAKQIDWETSLRDALNRPNRTCHGQHWVTVDPPPPPPPPKITRRFSSRRRADGNVIQDLTTGDIYGNAREAADHLHISISEHLCGHIKSVAGHQLRLIPGPAKALPPLPADLQRHPIRDLTDHLVYPDPMVLAVNLGVDPHDLYAAARRKNGTIAGHQVLFADQLQPEAIAAGWTFNTDYLPDPDLAEHSDDDDAGKYDANGFDVHRCRVCGCTDDDCQGCIDRTGQPCHWVEIDLCSACAAEED